MPKLTLLVGPPASGKSTLAKASNAVYVNQDSQKDKHLDIFLDALEKGEDVLVDRMNFNKQQRERYLGPAKLKGYSTHIVVLHEPYKVCLERARARFNQHETITEEKHIRGALKTFFGKYERPTSDEADQIDFIYPIGEKPSAIVCDLDGTLADCNHRRHHVRKQEGEKKDWAAFFRGIPDDPVNEWCEEILNAMRAKHKIVLCTGRDSNQQINTVNWLKKHEIQYDDLFMRDRTDSRQDAIVKEIILDFEILTRYTPYIMIDDRQQVVDMWRRRGFVCLQCDEGDF